MPTFAPAYATSDIRLGYRVSSHLDLSIVGQDLHRARHLEFPGGGVGNVEVPRRVAGKLTRHW